jgi:hypothetical protein
VWRDSLEKDGWYAWKRNESENDVSLKDLSRELCINKIESTYLLAKTPDAARPNTLSSRYGMNVFPVHTDYVLRDVPPNYIVLCAAKIRTVRTNLFNPFDVESVLGYNLLSSAIFKVVGGKCHYYIRFLDSIKGRHIFRYNPAVMIPANKQANQVDEFIRFHLGFFTSIDWEVASRVIINNWCIMHSRDAILSECNFVPIRRVSFWS